VPARRARLDVQVVAVVVAGHQAEVRDRGERGAARADHDADLASAHGEELPVPPCRTQVGCHRDVPTRSQDLVAGQLEPAHVTMIGHHEHCTTASRKGGAGQFRQRQRPLRPSVWPQRHGRERTSACGDVVDELVSTLVVGPTGRRRTRGNHWSIDVRGRRRWFALHAGMSGRDRLAEDVERLTRVASRHRFGERQYLGAEHPFGRDHGTDRRERPSRIGAGQPIDDESVAVTTRETDLDPDTRLRRFREVWWDGVVERPIKVGQSGIDADRGDR
jgi:hypothetical protein